MLMVREKSGNLRKKKLSQGKVREDESREKWVPWLTDMYLGCIWLRKNSEKGQLLQVRIWQIQASLNLNPDNFQKVSEN